MWTCRFVVPKSPETGGVEADSAAEAASEFHHRHEVGLTYRHETEAEGLTKISFALVGVTDATGKTTDLVARSYSRRIWRKGGVRPGSTLAEIAAALGWEHPPSELIEPGWDQEESAESAVYRSRRCE